jgi:hypothetical protein
MKLKIKELTTERAWRAATGITAEKFYKLLPIFKSIYLETHFKSLSERKVGDSASYCIQDEEELLYFTLFSLKSGLNYDILGIVVGMSASNAQRNQRIGIDILEKSLAEQDYMPKRNFLNIEDFLAHFKDEEELILDATEQRIQRPNDYEQQKDYYSGKKKLIRLKQ